jgi:hypothetical protein
MTAYIQLADKLVEISGKVTKEAIIQALGYKPATGEFAELKNNPFVDDKSDAYKIVDEKGNIIAMFDKDGLHTTKIDVTEAIVAPNLTVNSVYSQKSDIEGTLTATNIFVAEDLQTKYANVSDKFTALNVEINGNLEAENLQSQSTEDFKIADSNNNIIMSVNNEGVSSTEFIAKTSNAIHKLSTKADENHTHGLLKLGGDVQGASSFGKNGATINVTVINDSHTHDLRYYSKYELSETGLPLLASPDSNFRIIDKNSNIMVDVDSDGLKAAAVILPQGDVQTQIDERYTKDELSNTGVDYIAASVVRDKSNDFAVMDQHNNTIMRVGSNGVTSTEIIAQGADGKIHKLSEKANVSDIPSLDGYAEKAYVDELNQSVGNKQDTINDLETIRQGAAKGATAIQAVDTGDVLDDVDVEYATKAYVDGLVGDINSVLESIISGDIKEDINNVLESIINGEE